MNLVGKKVKSKAYGLGTITKADEKYVTISFSIGEKPFPYTSFINGKYLVAEDETIQAYCEEKGKETLPPPPKPFIPIIPIYKSRAISKGSALDISPHKGRAVFWVFQGKEYHKELSEGYIWAPCEDASGNAPSHWAMLENVKAGDIIFHGLSQCISAISIAEGGCFDSKIKDGVTLGRQVNCKTVLIKNTLVTKNYKKEIILFCGKYKYQPFDKNGNGRMGYLFDLNDSLAGLFTRELIKNNPTILVDIPELVDIKDL